MRCNAWGRRARRTRRSVARIAWQEGRGVTAVETDGPAGRETFTGDAYVSSMALSDAVFALDPPPPPEVLDAARALRYRDYILVALMFEGERFFPDNWVYIHSPEVRIGRVHATVRGDGTVGGQARIAWISRHENSCSSCNLTAGDAGT